MRIPSILAAASLAAGLLVGAAPAYAAQPAVGDCLDLPVTAKWFDNFVIGTLVDCEAPHNSEVFHLGAYPDDWGAPSTEKERIGDYGQFTSRLCPYTTLNAYLEAGGLEPKMILDRFYTTAVPPTDEAWEAGDRTVQCVVYALSGPWGKDKPTAWTGTIPERVLAEGWKPFALCSKAMPKSGTDSGNPPFRCTKPSQWIAIGRATNLTGAAGRPFPGQQIQAQADRRCAKEAKGFIKGKAKAFAAVESQEMWEQGIREAVCYIPLQNWNGKSVA